MDPNDGIDPLSQGQGVGQAVPSVPLQYQQQAPMVSQQNAYEQPGAVQYSQSQTSVAPAQQLPIQDVRPGWQQELQQTPVDPPWSSSQSESYQIQPLQSSALASFDRFQSDQPQVASQASAAYDLLAEPFIDTSQSPTATSRNPAFKIILILIVLILIAATGALGFNMGYQKGVADTKNTAPKPTPTTSTAEDLNEEPQDHEEPELVFELSKPDFAEEILEGKLGEQLDASDGLIVNVYKIDTTYMPESGGEEAVEGSFIKVDLLLGNADEARSKTIKKNSFTLVDESEELLEPLDDLSDGLGTPGSVTLSPGMKSRMSIVYAISSESSWYQLIRSQAYQVGGQTRNVSMAIDLSSAVQASGGSTVSEPRE